MCFTFFHSWFRKNHVNVESNAEEIPKSGFKWTLYSPCDNLLTFVRRISSMRKRFLRQSTQASLEQGKLIKFAIRPRNETSLAVLPACTLIHHNLNFIRSCPRAIAIFLQARKGLCHLRLLHDSNVSVIFMTIQPKKSATVGTKKQISTEFRRAFDTHWRWWKVATSMNKMKTFVYEERSHSQRRAPIAGCTIEKHPDVLSLKNRSDRRSKELTIQNWLPKRMLTRLVHVELPLTLLGKPTHRPLQESYHL